MPHADEMMRLAGHVRIRMNSDSIDGTEIAKDLSALAQMARNALSIKGDVDVTFDPARACYIMTLKRPDADGGNMCSSSRLFDPDAAAMPPLHLASVRTINRLDMCLTREEKRRDGRKGILS
jgi:hypothetical protein